MTKLKEAISSAVEERVIALTTDIEDRLKAISKDAIAKREAEPAEDRALAGKFLKALASRDTKTLSELQGDIAKGYAAKSQNIGTDGDGGYLVPVTIDKSIISKLEYVSPVRRMANVISNMPAKLTLHTGSLPTAYWVDEEAAITESKVTFTPKTLTPEKMAALDTLSREFLEDAESNPATQNYIEDRFVLALALLENSAFVSGDGSSKPYGFRSSDITPSTVSMAGAAVAYGDFVNLKWKLGAAYVDRGAFATSPEGLAIIEGMTDDNGRPLYRESLAVDTPSTFLGRPIYVIDEIPANLGTGTDETELWYADWKAGYTIGDRGGLHVDYGTSDDDFARDRVKLRLIRRVAGRPVGNYNFAKLQFK